MTPTVFLITLADGSRRRVTCVLDTDRHTSHYVREYLGEIASRNRAFGRQTPRVVAIEELRDDDRNSKRSA